MLNLTLIRAEDLTCRGRDGPLRSYATAWVDDDIWFPTDIDEEGDSCPTWGKILSIPFRGPIDDETTLKIVAFDAGREGKHKKIGSAKLKLKEVVLNVGYGKAEERTLELTRFPNRLHGRVFVKVSIESPGTAQLDGQPQMKTKKFKKFKKFVKGLSRGAMVAATFDGDGISDIVETLGDALPL